MTLPTQLVLRVLLEDPTRELYGLQICEAAGLPSGTIHPILARLENAGWLASRWEEVDPSERGRPRRRYYRINPNSIVTIQAALARTTTSASALARLRPGLSGGEL
jgi:DNA-binding PadR family transcriptional regulator